MFKRPEPRLFENQAVRLIPLQKSHAKELFEASQKNKESVFYHMFFGPFNSVSEVESYIDNSLKNNQNIVFSVHSKRLAKIIGSCSIINIDNTSGNAEIGSIWYGSDAQGTEINSNAIYLLLEYLFEQLGYRRIVWKCDFTNESSKNAAIKLGFEYEGIFKKHMMIKGRSRDTVWYSVIDDTWPEKKKKLKRRIANKMSNIM